MTLNKTLLIGRLVADPQIKYSQSGIAICKFNLAVERGFKDNTGNKVTDFIPCLAFKKTAENLANHMKKGSRILVDGGLQTGSYEKDDSTKVYTWEVIANNIQFLEYRQQQGQQNNTQSNYTRVDEDPFSNSKGPIEISESDLPF